MLYIENSIEGYKKYVENKMKKLNSNNINNVELFFESILCSMNCIKDKRLNKYIYENKKIKDILKFSTISKQDFKNEYSTSIDLLYISEFSSFNLNKIISVLTIDDFLNFSTKTDYNYISKFDIEKYLKNLEVISNDFIIENKSNLKFDFGEEINLDICNIELKDNVKALILYHENNLTTPNSTNSKYLKKPQFEILYIK